MSNDPCPTLWYRLMGCSDVVPALEHDCGGGPSLLVNSVILLPSSAKLMDKLRFLLLLSLV